MEYAVAITVVLQWVVISMFTAVGFHTAAACAVDTTVAHAVAAP